MAISRRLLVIVLVSLGCVGSDQLTKAIALEHLPQSAPWSFLGDAVRLQVAHNAGSFLGLGASLPDAWRQAVFVAGVSGVLVALLAWSLLARTLTMASLIAIALIVSGGASNLADRLVRDGRVVDFINVGFGPLRTGIFNIADVAIMAGVLAIAASGVRKPV